MVDGATPTDRSDITLGLEGGGTRTSVLLVDARDHQIRYFEAGPANLRLMKPGDLRAHLHSIREQLPVLPARIGIGLAGVRVDADHARLRSAVSEVWPGIPCATSDDLDTALEATEWHPDCAVQVLVLSGTGSCTTGRRRDGESTKLGGRGHVLGDRASACDIAQHALRAVMTISDLEDSWPALGSDILSYLQMNEPEDLIEWSIDAPKNELASVAIPVFQAACSRGDRIATAVLEKARSRLCTDATACAERLASQNDRVQFIFNGAVLTRNPDFSRAVAERLKQQNPGCLVTPLTRPSVWGAVALARSSASSPAPGLAGEVSISEEVPWRPPTSSPTEQRNPESTDFASLSVEGGIQLMLAAESKTTEAIAAESGAIAWTIERVVRGFAEGGRLFYAGAGTSGRLGVLDASECPPTFSVPYDQVQGIIAGGRVALWNAVEGAEDDLGSGRRSIAMQRIDPNDVVIGISASGYAPFVWGCLKEAKERGAATVLLCCNPTYHGHSLPDRVIAPDTGPEVLTGSTRLKAGTATKLVLNMISTLSMTHSGKVMSNYMIDLNASNTKLRDRAVRIVEEITGVDAIESRRALQASDWIVRDACTILSQ